MDLAWYGTLIMVGEVYPFDHGMIASMPTPTHVKLVAALASRQWTTKELSQKYNMTPDAIREFVEENRPEIERARMLYEMTAEESPLDEDGLWITDKKIRLKRYQNVADVLYLSALTSFDATILREFRSYLYMVAQELGQLQHRGSAGLGDGGTVKYVLEGVDLDDLK